MDKQNTQKNAWFSGRAKAAYPLFFIVGVPVVLATFTFGRYLFTRSSLNKRQYEIIPTRDEKESILRGKLPLANSYKTTYKTVESREQNE
jgi:hypothetical protein